MGVVPSSHDEPHTSTRRDASRSATCCRPSAKRGCRALDRRRLSRHHVGSVRPQHRLGVERVEGRTYRGERRDGPAPPARAGSRGTRASCGRHAVSHARANGRAGGIRAVGIAPAQPPLPIFAFAREGAERPRDRPCRMHGIGGKGRGRPLPGLSLFGDFRGARDPIGRRHVGGREDHGGRRGFAAHRGPFPGPAFYSRRRQIHDGVPATRLDRGPASVASVTLSASRA